MSSQRCVDSVAVGMLIVHLFKTILMVFLRAATTTEQLAHRVEVIQQHPLLCLIVVDKCFFEYFFLFHTTDKQVILFFSWADLEQLKDHPWWWNQVVLFLLLLIFNHHIKSTNCLHGFGLHHYWNENQMFFNELSMRK